MPSSPSPSHLPILTRSACSHSDSLGRPGNVASLALVIYDSHVAIADVQHVIVFVLEGKDMFR